MSTNENMDVLRKRQEVFNKNFFIVEEFRHSMSLLEQKVIVYISSILKTQTTANQALKHQVLLEYMFDIEEFCKVCRIYDTKHEKYNLAKNVLQDLRRQYCWLLQEDDTEATVSWISKIWCGYKTYKIKILLDEELSLYIDWRKTPMALA